MRALEYLRSPSRIWAIEEGAWQEMEAICQGQNLTLDAIEASIGKMNNKKTNAYEVVDGVAIIPVVGPIVRYGNLFSSISGATSVSKLTHDFNTALNDEDVKAIMFEIDSPGGEANGINEFSEQIYAARGIKPMQAYISGQGCSAAYWIASAVDEGGVFIDETAVAGSIGVAAVVKDSEGKDSAAGIKTYKFVSEGSENKRPDLDTDEGRDVVMKSLNDMAHVFRSKVARNRSNENTSLTVRDVIEKFHRGGVLMGQKAVEVGLADGIGSYKQVLDNLISKSGDAEEASLENIEENFMANEELKPKADASNLVDVAELEAIQAKLENAETEKAELAQQIEEVQAQITELQTQLTAEAQAKATLEKENLSLKAEAAADELAGKITPAQRASFIKGYVLAATDDANSPIDGESRLNNFLGMWKASDDHKLEEEELAPEGTSDLAAAREGEDDGLTALLENAKAYAAKQNQKLHAVS